MNRKEKLKLGLFCRKFRIEKLGISLKDFSILNKDIPTNISAFEGGRANNIKYLGYYYAQCKNREQQDYFKRGVFK